MFTKTYELTKGPPAMPWAEYEGIVNHSWQSLLNSGKADETLFQDFFEQHPCMLPGPFGMIGTSGHSPHPAAIISQPILPDFTQKIPDFMWIARNSETIYPILIEIESPSKPWFSQNDRPSAKLTQARDQITEWRSWFSAPLNVARLRDYYEIEMRSENIQPLYVLIYGRRSEANQSRIRQSKRGSMNRLDEFSMTYDRLGPQKGADEFYTVRRDQRGYRAMYIPPTSTIGPLLSSHRASIRDKDMAVRNSPYFTDERREFLISRFPYWDTWAKLPRQGIIYTGDYE